MLLTRLESTALVKRQPSALRASSIKDYFDARDGLGFGYSPLGSGHHAVMITCVVPD